MGFKVTHIHLKSPDPDATIKWYVENLGAEVVRSTPNGGGYRINLHGLPINISAFVATQAHKQNYGFEHIGLNTDDPAGVAKTLEANGARLLEKCSGQGGRDVFFVDGPDGIMFEIAKAIQAQP